MDPEIYLWTKNVALVNAQSQGKCTDRADPKPSFKFIINYTLKAMLRATATKKFTWQSFGEYASVNMLERRGPNGTGGCTHIVSSPLWFCKYGRIWQISPDFIYLCVIASNCLFLKIAQHRLNRHLNYTQMHAFQGCQAIIVSCYKVAHSSKDHPRWISVKKI